MGDLTILRNSSLQILRANNRILRSTQGLYWTWEIDELIAQGWIPVATGAELDALRTTTSQTMGVGTIWQGTYTTGLDKNYIQVRNLDLSAYASWNIIGNAFGALGSPFSGSYDGNELGIYNLSTIRGLFGTVNSSTTEIKNCRVFGETTTTISAFASLLVQVLTSGKINNCIVRGNITHTSGSVDGMIAGAINGSDCEVSDCVAFGNITTTAGGGGIVGRVESGGSNITISNCHYYGDITITTSNGLAGGITYYAYNTTITGCTFTGNINAAGYPYIGGIIQLADNCDISNCTFTGTLSSGLYTGGICGYLQNTSTISECSFYGTVNINTGLSLAGRGTGGICFSVASGCSVSDCLFSGTMEVNVTTTTRTLGGIVSYNNGTITGCRAEINFILNTASSEAGGVCGDHRTGTITKCSAVGSITQKGNTGGFVGGLVGVCYAPVTDSYAIMDITISPTADIGGLCGYASAAITNCYAAGEMTITGGSRIGGLLGRIAGAGASVNSYYDKDTTGMTDTGKGLPRTTAQMQEGTADSFILPAGGTDPDSLAANAMYTSWDDVNTWEFGTTSEYPTLK